MSEENPKNKGSQTSRETEFGEPLWLDVLKSTGVGLAYFTFVIVLGGALAIAVIAPWGRASFDCSIYFHEDWEVSEFYLYEPSAMKNGLVQRL